ncbi:MAG: mycofactocin system transcriptional regulator [Conexibacter sp.]|jgi:AcrR family transcriptional regulator|nr:mycofactocin system transcriptional regulator [Conexibacter sp.]
MSSAVPAPADPAPAPLSLRERNRERVLEEISAAAQRLFLKDGFAATSVERIAQEAGVSPRTLFRHFPSKEDVVFHRHRKAVEAMRAALAATPPEVPAFQAIDDAAGVAFAPFVRETMRLLRREPVLLARLDELGREMERAIADFLAERAGGGEQAQRDAALLAGAIAGTMRTARRQALVSGVRWDPASFARAWELLAPLAPDRESADAAQRSCPDS